MLMQSIKWCIIFTITYYKLNFVVSTIFLICASNYDTLISFVTKIIVILVQWGETPLHFAACNNALDTTALLIERGAKVNALEQVHQYLFNFRRFTYSSITTSTYPRFTL